MTRWNDEQPEDPRPGFYYVSCQRDDGRSARIRGPYATHAAALDAVRAVKDVAQDVDSRAHWYAWGTCRSETDLGPGALGPAEVDPLVLDRCSRCARPCHASESGDDEVCLACRAEGA